MSHYIQDNQACIKTTDYKYILLTKGGDNNVCSAETNKRCTSWSICGVFASLEDYMHFIDVIMISDIKSGMWKFNSLKNKFFNGFSEYENLIYNRFEKAFKKAIKIDFSISTINEDNLTEFQIKIQNALLDNKFSLKDQDGYSQNIRVMSYYSKEPEKEAVDRFKKTYKPTKDLKHGYREFCKKNSTITSFEAFKDVNFCKELNNFDIRFSGAYMLESKTLYPISLESFLALYENNHKRLLETYEYPFNQLFENYPYYFYELFDTTSMLIDMQNIIDNLDEDDIKYLKNKYIKSLDLCKSFLEKDHIDYKALKKEREENAHKEFIKIWNSLEVRAWCVHTNKYITEDLSKLEYLINIGFFTLDEIKDSCDDTLDKIISHHEHQKVKNKKVVEQLAFTLIKDYSTLLNKNSIDLICKYFKLNKPTEKDYEETFKQLKKDKHIQPTSAYINGCLF